MFGMEGMDPRKIKRMERRMLGDEVYYAYLAGTDLGERGKPYRNPYPAGRRHAEFKRGYDQADPMGAWHGRNI